MTVMQPTTTQTTSGASTTAVPVGLDRVGSPMSVALNVTAAGGTTPSMTVTVQWSGDGSVWFDPDPAEAFGTISAAKRVVALFTIRAPYARLAWTVAGSAPTFTFTADAFAGQHVATTAAPV